MRVKRSLGLAACVVALVLATIFVADAKKLAPSYALENNVNPRSYMPLAVGNSWTYIWQNKVTSDDKAPDEQKEPTYYSFGYYNGRTYTGGIYLYELQTHKEVYSIYRQDKNSFFFNIACASDDCGRNKYGDGRFHDSIENAWTWTDTSGGGQLNIVLTETIKRHPPETQPGDPGGVITVDNRNIIHVVKKNNRWSLRGLGFYFGENMEIDHNFEDHSVTVPAGKFDHCILITETYKTDFHDKPLVFSVFKYYAPDVGKVKEYQQLKDGTITYTMELESYKVAK